MNLNHQHYQQQFLTSANGHVPNGAEPYGVRLQPVAAGEGGEIWRVIGVHHLSPNENQGNHHVYIDVLDAGGQRINDPNVRVHWGWEGQSPDQKTNPAALDKGASEPATNIPIFDGQRIWVAVDGRGLSSDRVENLHTDHEDELTADGQKWNSKGHHSFYIVFQQQRHRSQTLPVDNHPVEPVHMDPLPIGPLGGGLPLTPQPGPLRQGSVLLRHKLGIDGNAPIDARSGVIAGRLANPNLLRELGVGWVRLNFIMSPWKDPHDGALHQGRTWAQTYQQIIDNLKAQGLRIFGLISDETMDHPRGRFRQPPNGNPLDDTWISQYADRFVAIARLFKDDLDVLEMFNEPDDWKEKEVPGFTDQSKNYVHPEWFAAMMEAVYRAMRSPQNADLHHIPLVSGPLQGLDINDNAGVEYLSRTYDAGEDDFGWGMSSPYPFDGVGYHLYIAQNPGNPDVDIPAMYNRYMDELRALIERREGVLKPIYISEIGWETIVNEEKQADCLRVGMPIVLHDSSVALAFWFCIEDFEKKFGLFGEGMHHRKRPLEAFKQLAASNVDVPVPVAATGAAVAAAAIQSTPPVTPSVTLQPKTPPPAQLPVPGAGEWLGYVNVRVLNVRSSPDVSERNKIGELVLDRRVVARFVQGEWLFVNAGDVQGFVHGDYITPLPVQAGTRSVMASVADPASVADRGLERSVAETVLWTGTVQAAAGLHLRREAHTGASVITTLADSASVQVVGEEGGWLRVQTPFGAGYVHGDFVLRPGQKPSVAADKAMSVLRTWIRFKPMLLAQAKQLGIDPAVAVAVLLTESNGDAFDRSTGRMIIRFEVHLFHRYWGRNNEAQFNQHFQFDRTEKVWEGHQWRRDPNGEWQACHVLAENQAREWAVFDFARSLDEEAAIRSISMGAPQIMGFNYSTIGYVSPRAMFDAFQESEAAQIDGLFRFIRNQRLDGHLRSNDYLAFAKGYNGPGNPTLYRDRILSFIEAFHQEIGDQEIGDQEIGDVTAAAQETSRSLRPAPATDVATRLPLLDAPPLAGRNGKTLAESDPELYQAWSRHIQQGFENNQLMFDQVLKGFMSPYWTTVWMYRALFAVGILSFIAAIVLSIMGTSQTAETGVPVAVFGGLSVVAFLSYFLSKPLQALEENLQLITWLGIIYNSYWVRLVYTTKVDTVQDEIDATTNATIDKLKDLIETHKQLSGNRPGLR